MRAFLIGMVEILAGTGFNLFIGKVGMAVFRQDNRTTRIILRIVGIFLLINGISRAFHV